jgi:hypothetical protein
MGSGSLRRFRAIATRGGIGAPADVLPGVDGGHRRRDHDHETKDAQEWVDGDTCDEEAQPGKETYASKCRATPMNSPGARPTESVLQLWILGRERGFHLLEKPLLLI